MLNDDRIQESAPSAPAVTERDTVAVEAVRAGHTRYADEPRDYSGAARTTTAAEELRFQQGLAVLAEGAVRGVVGEYRNDLRVAEGHAACRHCGCIGVGS